MQAILPGRPQSKLQAVDVGVFEGQVVLAYISGTALIILDGPQSLVQTIYHDDLGDQELQAVSYCPSTGKIAVAASCNVYIYALREEVKGTLQWHYESTIYSPPDAGRLNCLSWGSDEELIVGSNALNLYSTHVPSGPASPGFPLHKSADGATKPIWSIPLPSPVFVASLSPSASLLATLTTYDCLVKIWRRLSFESAEFEYAYLRHPSTVTHLEWRSVAETDDENTRDRVETLYTICADGKFRIWVDDGLQNLNMLGLLAEIDMATAIQPRDALGTSQETARYAFTLPWTMLDQLGHVGNNATKSGLNSERHAQEYVKEVRSRQPDIVVVLDNHGHMSAWGVENVGCKKRNCDPLHAEPFHIALVDGLSFGFATSTNPVEQFSRVQAFPIPGTNGRLGILSLHFDGRLLWQETSLQALCDPSANRTRLYGTTELSGHAAPVKKIIRTASGQALISRTEDNECLVWKRSQQGQVVALQRSCRVTLTEHIHRTVLLMNGEFVAFLHHESISVWDCRKPQATELARRRYSATGRPLCLLIIPSANGNNSVYAVTITSTMATVAWHVHLPLGVSADYASIDDDVCTIKQISTTPLEKLEDVSYILAVDPAGAAQQAAESLDVYAQDVAISYSSTGMLRSYAARVDPNKETINFLATSTVNTKVLEPALASATSIHKAALVNKGRTGLTIWDTKSGRLDHEQTFAHEEIQDLDWASTPDKQSVLAVGFSHRVVVYTQLRYDYVNERPAWTSIKSIDLRHLTSHPIGDSVWFTAGSLVIGAGNALFLASNTVDLSVDLSPELMNTAVPHQGAARLFDLVSGLNGPLPVFHPQFIAQCILAGRLELAQRILVSLMKALKFYTDGDPLDPLLGVSAADFVSSADDVHVQGGRQVNDDPNTVTEDVSESLTTLLSEKSVPQLSSIEQFGLVDTIQCVATVEKHRRSIDDNAARYLLFWRQAILEARQSSRSGMQSGRSGMPTNAISWREILWAGHSSSQDILTDLISRHHDARMTWQDAKDAGLFIWIADRPALLSQFESIGKNAYTASEPKDPIACSLHYIALRKKAVLVGLWRMSTWAKEQNAVMKLLRNDFNDPRWKTAAAKNAYALMGKRRFEYAASFFLLADDLKSAVSVLYNQLDDLQLAIAVARVYDGDDSPVLKSLLRDKVLPLAVSTGNRWQASWAFWFLGQRGDAVRALVSPLHSLVESSGCDNVGVEESTGAKSFLNDDPALVVAYRQLREKSLQTLKGAMMVSGDEERQFVIKTATLLRRMGCDFLALDLVRNWDYLRPQLGGHAAREDNQVPEPTSAHFARSTLDGFSDINPQRLLRRRSSLVVDDLPSPTQQKHKTTETVRSGLPSILDGWGVSADEDASQKQRVPSMLDGFDTPDLDTKGTVEKQDDDNAKHTGTRQDSSESEDHPRAQAKADSRDFKEPDPSSLLDTFGF